MQNEDDVLLDGQFMNSLKRNNKQIKDDRALSIAEDAEIIYKRKVEDLQATLKKKRRDLDNMLDLSPTNTQTLILASDFNATEWANRDHALGLEIRNLEIEVNIARARYNQLFVVGTADAPTVIVTPQIPEA